MGNGCKAVKFEWKIIHYKKIIIRREFTRILLILLLTIPISPQVEYSIKDALKVVGYIEKLQEAQLTEYSGPQREIEVTERELNSYFAYLIDIDKEEIMKDLRLNIFAENRIEGKIFIDLQGQKLPEILRPQMNFYFGAKLDIKEKKVRVNIDKLFLEDQEINKVILDMVIYLASKINNTESGSISDWYILPFGIKDIRTKRGKAVFFY